MAPNPRRIAAKLDAIYAQLPRLDCQGLCADSCGPIPAGRAEKERMERRAGVELEAKPVTQLVGDTLEACHECSMMANGRCSVYDIRPMICRLWGLTEDMRCPYGCVPEGGHVPIDVGYALLAEAFAIAGYPPGWEDFAKQQIKELVRDPRKRAMFIQHHRPTIAGRRGSLPLTVIERGYQVRVTRTQPRGS